MEDKIKKIEDEYKKLHDELSNLRKEGADMKIAELSLMNIPSKIDYARISKKEEDFTNVMSLLKNIEVEMNEARNELDNSKENEILDIKKPSAREIIQDMLDGAAYFMQNARKSEAVDLYNEIMNQYKLLSKAEKKIVLPNCMELRKIILKKH